MTPDVLLLDYPAYAPYTAEATASAETGLTFAAMSPEAFARELPRCLILLNPGGWSISERALAATGCRVAVGYGVGTDWIDLGAAALLEVEVVNMPLANTVDVAVHALAMILACLRRLATLHAQMRAGQFDWTVARPLHRPSSTTVALLAFGNIPRALVRLGRQLGFRFLAYDPAVAAETIAAAGAVPVRAVEDLLRRADVLSVHLPATPETPGFLNRERLALLPHGASVVITGRGTTYDAKALADAVAHGDLSACALDVFPNEPLEQDLDLFRHDGFLLTPHMAGQSEEAIADQHGLAADAVRAWGMRSEQA